MNAACPIAKPKNFSVAQRRSSSPQMSDDLSDQVKEAAAKPKQVTVDGVTVQAQTIDDLIKADEFLERKKAIKKGGLRIQKIVPPGTA